MSSEIAATIEELEAEESRSPSQNNDRSGFLSQQKSASAPNLTLHQRMLSACAGSLITSLAVTPFDVVRIRLQQQQVLLPHTLAKTEECCKQVFWQEEATNKLPNQNTLRGKQANTIAGRGPTVDTALNEYCASNTCAQDVKIKGTFSGISKIYATEGFTSLYRGLSLVLLMAIPSNVVYFSGYEYLRDASPISHYSMLNPLLCGSLARVLSATTVAPIELLKTRLQAIPATSTLNSSKLMKIVLQNSFREIKDRGLGSLFRGLQITLWRDVPFSGIYWSSYEYISRSLQRNVSSLSIKNSNINTSASQTAKNIDYKVFATSFLSGCASGIIAAVLTNPFDVGKTRLQVSAKEEKTAMFKYLYDMTKMEGLGSLYVGLLPRCIRIAPSCAIMISTYELSKRFFANA